MLIDEKGSIVQLLSKQKNTDLWLVVQSFDTELLVCISVLLISFWLPANCGEQQPVNLRLHLCAL